jgi:hypothetical protein
MGKYTLFALAPTIFSTISAKLAFAMDKPVD